jgi:hypothetical protein
MRSPLKSLGWLGTLALAAFPIALAAGAVDKPQPEAKIKVLIIDGQNNHDWRTTTPHMKKVLEACGRFTVDVATTPQKPAKGGDVAGYREAMAKFRPDLEKYQVVLSNYNGDSWSEKFQADLENYVKTAKGALVIVHAANNSFGGWGEYNRMIGMGWRDNKFGDRLTLDAQGKEKRVAKGTGPGAGHGAYHPFTVTVRNADHPITKGMPSQWLHAGDELYHGMRGPIENVKLLATAYSDKKTGGTAEHEPMIWTVTYGKGRVFHTPMGHDINSMRCIGFITTLQRGTEWAATGKVTIPVPKNFPTAKKTSTLPAK